MQLRRNFLPKTLYDTSVTTFIVLIIPIIYYFELFIVLPQFYIPWSLWYNFHFLAGTYILFNVSSNFVAIMLCDTSIKGRILPTSLAPDSKFCAVCECIAPARSYHCDTCKTCILKRDHHCIFTGCCIGHHNQRFFLMFLFYVFIATIYASYYNLRFIFTIVDYGFYETICKLIFPLAFFLVDFSLQQLYVFFVMLCIIGCAFTGVLLYYHTSLLLRGMITHEKNKKIDIYDLGREKNIELALGHSWRLIWISPFVESRLPHDGVHWEARETLKSK